MSVPSWYHLNLSNHIPFGSVTQRKNELKEDEGQIDVFQNCIDNRSYRVAKGKCSVFIRRARCADKIHDDASGKPECRCCVKSVCQKALFQIVALPKENHVRRTENML